MSNYKVEINGLVKEEGFTYAGVQRFTNLSELEEYKELLNKDIEDIMLFSKETDSEIIGSLNSFYKYIEMENMDVIITHAFPIKLNTDHKEIYSYCESKGIMFGVTPTHEKVLKATLQGCYSGLEEAWMKTMDYAFNNNLYPNSYYPFIERYVVASDSEENVENNITEIIVPIASL